MNCHYCEKDYCECPSEFCTYCNVNIAFDGDGDKIIHEMKCVKQHQGLALNSYQRDRLLKEMLNHPTMNTGDWYNEVWSKLCIMKYGKPFYDIEQIKKDLELA